MNDLAQRIRQGERRALAKGITLVESKSPSAREEANQLLTDLIRTGSESTRLGITGMPGVGKSTFIEAFGIHVLEAADDCQNRRVAVLAVDPSSPVTGGSIMGDRTRMEQLSKHKRAFIRPSPSGSTLGGVASRTREAILLCEAAGYNYIIVETVGVGQSEAIVSSMVDCFTLLQLPHAGDELQGIKKGVLELADLVVVTKNDGSLRAAAQLTKGDLTRALMLTRGQEEWAVPVQTCSALENNGIDACFETIEAFLSHQREKGYFQSRRQGQISKWFQDELYRQILHAIKSNAATADLIQKSELDIVRREQTPSAAVAKLVAQILR